MKNINLLLLTLLVIIITAPNITLASVANPDFDVTKECITNPVGVGQEAIFRITVTNTGNTPLTINDSEGLWSGANLPIDGSLIEEIGILVEEGDTVIPNSITVTATCTEVPAYVGEKTASGLCSVYSELICGFTQGFYGNEGGKVDGRTTTEIIDTVLGDGVVVGIEGVLTITFDSAACIILRLPAGGSPKALPSELVGNVDCDNLPDSLVKKNKPEINNVLIGQVVALTLNVRLSPGLASLELTEVPGTIPSWVLEELDENATVMDLLGLANAALADGASKSQLSAINDAVTAINEAFDECVYIVPGTEPEPEPLPE